MGKFEAVSKLGFGTGAQTGLGVEDKYGVDSQGFYVQKDLIFEGVKFSFEAEARGELLKVTKSRKKSMMSIGGKIEGEITMLAHTFSTDKMYF